MLEEFKKFLMRGNVMDLAIGVIIGGAFGKIISSLVNDILMPPLGLLLGKVDFTNLFASLTNTKYATLAEAQAAGAPTLNYGLFINNVVDFLIISLVIFLLIRAINRLSKKQEAAAPETRACPHCLSQIPLKASRCPACTSEVTPQS